MESPPHRTTYSPNILSLPDELLVGIFSAVKSWNPANHARHTDYASSSRDIASVRLVCRRFDAAASHLLVHYLRLPADDDDGLFSARTLDRLEAIAGHPAIGKGVRIVRLEALHYSSVLAGSLEAFARHAVAGVLGRARAYRQAFDVEVERAQADGDYDGEGEEYLWRREAEVDAVLQRARAVLTTGGVLGCRRTGEVAGGEGSRPEALHWEEEEEIERERYARALRSAYELYPSRYNEQESLRRDNTFLKRFAAAMAKMPRAKILEVLDFHHDPQYCPSREGEDELAGLLKIESLARPMSWEYMLGRKLGSPPSEILFALPVELQKAGVRLDRLSVQTSTLAEDFYPLLRSADAGEHERLVAAVRGLGVESFSLVQICEPPTPQLEPARTTPSAADVDAFRSYVAAMASSDRLARLRVMLDGGWADGSLDPQGTFSFGDLVVAAAAGRRRDEDGSGEVSRPRGLVDVHLTNVPLRVEEMEGLVGATAARAEAGPGEEGGCMDFLTLARTRLVSGTWCQALEVLRRLDVGDKELVEPLGAECSDLAALISGRYHSIFSTGPGRVRSVAEQFINGEVESNPLLESRPEGFVDSLVDEEITIEIFVHD